MYGPNTSMLVFLSFFSSPDVKAEMSIQERLQKFPVPDSIWEEYHIDQEIFITGTNAGHADQV